MRNYIVKLALSVPAINELRTSRNDLLSHRNELLGQRDDLLSHRADLLSETKGLREQLEIERDEAAKESKHLRALIAELQKKHDAVAVDNRCMQAYRDILLADNQALRREQRVLRAELERASASSNSLVPAKDVAVHEDIVCGASLTALFAEPIAHMGEQVGCENFQEIYCLRSDIGSPKIGLTEQFTENADEYHRRYSNVGLFKGMLELASKHCSIPKNPVVFDLGSGSGNTVFAALDLLPGSRVIATDLSEFLLRILRDYAAQREEYRDRILLVCQDASINSLRPKSVDLVLGGAILHHLIDPSHAVLAGLSALKPGGSAIFFEPFELGHGVIRLFIREILTAENEQAERIDPEVKTFLLAIDLDCKVRSVTPKDDPIFLSIDDKWLFTKSYFEKLADIAGASSLKVVPIGDQRTAISSKIASLLQVGLGRKRDALPDWVWQIASAYDEVFSEDAREELPIEACVIITK